MKSILIIVPYDEVYPPMNGGMQRCFNIIIQLAKHFDVTLIIHQGKTDFLKAIAAYPAIANVQVKSTKDYMHKAGLIGLLPTKIANAIRYRWYKQQLKGPADGLFLQYYPVLNVLLKQHKYDVIILENLATLNAVSIIRKYDSSVKIVYDAHNVDSILALVAVEKWAMEKPTQSLINAAEASLCKTVDAVLACSQHDLDELKKLNGGKLSGAVIPNGVAVATHLADEGVLQEMPEYILFCGSLHAVPNSEGLLWFYNKIWLAVKQSFPSLKLLIVGSGNTPESLHPLLNDASIHFTGAVEEVRPWYNKAAVAIVPLLSGSGTRLKILEAMGLGLPVISTSKGAEGIAYSNGQDIIIADKETDYAAALINLLNSKQTRINIQQNARKLAKAIYDWDIVGNSLASYLNKGL